jgi:transposase
LQQRDDEIPLDHWVRELDTFIEQLDLSDLLEQYRGTGSEPYHPSLMLKLAVAASFQGHGSPASWAKLTAESIPIQWLVRGIRPSRTCCYNFRDRVGHTIEQLVDQGVKKLRDEGLIDPKIGFQDGTAIRAAASRHRVVNGKTLERRRQTLAEAIKRDAEAIPVDEAEFPKWLAKTPAGRQDQKGRFDQAAEILAERHKENAAQRKDRRLSEDKVQVSLSEPEAPLGRDKERVFCPLYTTQFMVEPSSLVILSFQVFAQKTDAGTLPVMLDRTAAVLGHQLDTVVADGAYSTILDLQACKERNVELIAGPSNENQKPTKKSRKIDKSQFHWLPDENTYRCPQGHKLEYRSKDRVKRRGGETVIEHRFQCPPEHCTVCPVRNDCVSNAEKGRVVKRLEGQDLLEIHNEHMKTDRARRLYKQRGQVIERAFGDVKQHRNCRRLHGRQLNRARAEIGLLVFVENFLASRRLRKNAINPMRTAS